MNNGPEVALVTGASGGIGRNIARGLAGKGLRLGLAYHSNNEGIQALSSELTERGQEHLLVCVDLTQEESIEKMVSAVVTRFGGVDVLINNAGVNCSQVVWKLDLPSWEKVIAVNLTGPFLCIKHVLPHMRAKGFGRIVNISSVVGQTGVFGTSAYAASKAGLIGLTKTVAKETANKNITVNALALGYFSEGMIEQVPEAMLAEIVKSVPKGALGDPQEVVRCIEYLIGPGASYVTGQTINLNGGLYC